MDITTIDAPSFATRVAQVAAAELYGLLTVEPDQVWSPAQMQNWYNRHRAPPDLWQFAADVEAMGQYVTKYQVETGERLYRWAGPRGIARLGNWPDEPLAVRQAYDAFVDTCRVTYLGLAGVQRAFEEARRAAGVRPPPGLKLEDSIFEPDEPLGKLRPEALEAQALIARYDRGRAEAAALAAAERRQQDEADAAARAAEEKRQQRTARRKPPAPIAAGEALAQHQPNRGGRGKRNPD